MDLSTFNSAGQIVANPLNECCLISGARRAPAHMKIARAQSSVTPSPGRGTRGVKCAPTLAFVFTVMPARRAICQALGWAQATTSDVEGLNLPCREMRGFIACFRSRQYLSVDPISQERLPSRDRQGVYSAQHVRTPPPALNCLQDTSG